MKLDELECIEESIWQAKVGDLFFKCGDRNTSYFQARVKQRIRTNNTRYLKNDKGVWMSSRIDIRNHICEFFFKICTSYIKEVPRELPLICQVVSFEENEHLVRNITLDEWKSVVLWMHPKSLGPDGFILEFYHTKKLGIHELVSKRSFQVKKF